jgi:type IV pilus biogenesis protein CpaD/CtpE
VAEVEAVEQRADRQRIDVVEYVQPRVPVAMGDIQHVPEGRSQRRAQRDRSERRAADPQDDDVAPAAARLFGEAHDLIVQVAVAGQIEKAERSRVVSLPEGSVRVAEARGVLAELRLRDAGRGVARDHVRVVEAQGHVSRSAR